MTVTADPSADRAGSSFFAPGLRIRKLGELQPGPQPGDDLDADVLADVRSVEITRVHTGSSQYSITLNNWYTSTAADRRGPEAIDSRELDGRDRPEWPRHKYNAFDLLKFGDRLRLDLRYWPDRAGSGTESGAASGDDPVAHGLNQWVPMVSGPISDMRFEFGSSGATVTITGEDDLSPLRDGHRGRLQLQPGTDQAQIDEVISLSNYPLERTESPVTEWPDFASHGEAPEESIGDGQSYLATIEKFAGRLDLEVFLEFADLDDPDAGVALHVEPARSGRSPLDGTSEVYVIERAKSLLSFAPTLKVTDQPSELRVRGRHVDPENPDPVDVTADGSALKGELHPGTGPSAPRSAAEVREHFFPNRSNPLVVANATNLDDQRGRHLAETTLRQKAREFLTIEASTIGLPRLRPGRYVEIRGMRAPFDGFYYVTKTVHSYGNDGYTTRFSARRPGMPIPPYEDS